MFNREILDSLKAKDLSGAKKAFTLNAIDSLRKGKYKGIHSVFSGYNEAYREEFNDDPVSLVNSLVDAGIIATIPCKGGVTIYHPADKPTAVRNNPKATLAAMGL